MYSKCFRVFGSVFTRRNAAPRVSSGDSLADLLRGLGPCMLCTPMCHRFAPFSAECVIVGFLERTWRCLWNPEGFLVGPPGVLGAAWGSLGSLVALEVSLDHSLGGPGGSLGSPCPGRVPHMLRTTMFQRFLFVGALAYLVFLFLYLLYCLFVCFDSWICSSYTRFQMLCILPVL